MFLLDDNLRLTFCLLILFLLFLHSFWSVSGYLNFLGIFTMSTTIFASIFVSSTFVLALLPLLASYYFTVCKIYLSILQCKRYDRLKEQIFPTKEIIFKRLETGDEAHVEFIRMACARWGPIRLKHIIAWRFVEIYAENIHIFFSLSLSLYSFLPFAFSFIFILFSCAYINRIFFVVIFLHHLIASQSTQEMPSIFMHSGGYFHLFKISRIVSI